MSMRTLHEIMDADKYLIDSNRELHTKMALHHRYVTHDQWPEAEKQKLIKEKRPVLEIDITTPKLDTYSGVERSFRTGIRAKPTESRDEDQAKLATALLIWHNRNGRLDRISSHVFKDAGIDGIGWYDCRVKIGKDFLGELVVERFSGFNVRFDRQTKKPDFSDCPIIEKDRWMSPAYMTAYWGVDFDTIGPDATASEVSGILSRESDDYPSEFMDSEEWININFDSTRRLRRVTEISWREYKKSKYLLITEGPSSGQVVNVENMFEIRAIRSLWKLASAQMGKPAEVKTLNDIVELSAGLGFMGFKPFSRIDEEIWSTTYTGGKILEEPHREPYKHGEFTLIPNIAFFGERQDGALRTIGIVEALIGLQDEKNKRRSQFTHILNTVPKGGGEVSASAGLSDTQIKNMGETGVYNKIQGDVNKAVRHRDLKYIGMLQHYMELEKSAEIDADKNSRVGLPLQGISSNSRESGFAARTRINQAMMGLAEPLENHNHSKISLARQMISNMQQFYPESKVERIINTDDLQLQDPRSIQSFLANFAISDYDITIEEGETSSTVRGWMRQEIQELLPYVGDYAPALLPILIKLSDYPNKDEIIEAIQSQQQALAQQAGTSQSGNGNGAAGLNGGPRAAQPATAPLQ